MSPFVEQDIGPGRRSQGVAKSCTGRGGMLIEADLDVLVTVYRVIVWRRNGNCLDFV